MKTSFFPILMLSLAACGSDAPPQQILTPASAQAKALKDKFAAQQNCPVYEAIDTLACAGGIMQAACKDPQGTLQVGYFTKSPADPNAWISEKDVDAQIAEAQARLADGQAKKAAFAAAKGTACTPD